MVHLHAMHLHAMHFHLAVHFHLARLGSLLHQYACWHLALAAAVHNRALLV